MEKMKMQTADLADEKFRKLSELFPEAVTEAIDENGEVVRAIDKDVLMQEIATKVVDGPEERYQFTWPDKRKSARLASAPVRAALRPCREESVDFDKTENLYIEGDNLDVLKLLRETYLGKVKMIYIDPPYNTGNDFVYEDDFAGDTDEFLTRDGQYDEQGNRLVQNTDSNGRFHTDWLNMIYPRLKIAKDLLTEDGVIFISIGQDELHNVIKICDEIFMPENRAGIISRVMKSGGAKGQFFSPNIEYITVYVKNKNESGSFREAISEEIIKKLYTSIETEGPKVGQRYRPFGLYQSSLEERANQRYYIECPDGTLVIPPGKTFPQEPCDAAMVIPSKGDGCWRWSKNRYLEEKQKGNIVFKKSDGVLVNSEGEKAIWNIYTKIWLSDRQEEGAVPIDLITKWENRQSAKELHDLAIPFDFAKPVNLIKYLFSLPPNSADATFIDFFSGSATTAHAVLKSNAEDGGTRKFIMVQLPEACPEGSEALKAGYKNICEIGKERIRRAGKKIKEENATPAPNLDIGFRVLKLDSTNMEEVYYDPQETRPEDLLSRISNIKPDRSSEDLLFQVMLEFGILLSSKIEKSKIAGKEIFNVADNFLIACFEEDVTDDVLTAIAKQNPTYVVLRDSSFADDSVAANFEQIFNTYSPDTTRRVL